jgi:hypothetical protein
MFKPLKDKPNYPYDSPEYKKCQESIAFHKKLFGKSLIVAVVFFLLYWPIHLKIFLILGTIAAILCAVGFVVEEIKTNELYGDHGDDERNKK